jgi:hypothetical protein
MRLLRLFDPRKTVDIEACDMQLATNDKAIRFRRPIVLQSFARGMAVGAALGICYSRRTDEAASRFPILRGRERFTSASGAFQAKCA